ncbi:multidrug transporter [Pannonibacter phragmitetus]|uniref:MFS transporter n=1 Tax=Pannonibacter phragmitetus TaxID=121719 RepID=UPI00067E1C67|nr:MFS transporter [Pannonibacter phragmitetus]KND18215.1 multidrug transporter [Pannonibacter phragmitetus]
MSFRSPSDGITTGRSLDWRHILPVFVIVCTYAAGTAAVLPVLPFHIRAMGGSPLVLGIVIAAEAVGQFVSAPTLGQLSDRFGRKRILMASQLVSAASLLLLTFAPNVAVILIARAMFGLTVGNISVTAAYVADHTDTGNRRRAMGILMGGAGVGGIIGAGLSGFLSGRSLTAPILAAVGLVALSIVATLLRLENRQAPKQIDGKPLAKRVSFQAIVASPGIRILVLVMLFHFFAYGTYISQLPVFLGDTFIWNGHPFSAKELSYLIMADGVINVFAQLFLLGWLSRYLTERHLILLIFALIATGFLMAGLATTIPVLLIAVFCVSTGDALAKPTYMAALSTRVPAERQGIIMGAAQSLVAATDVASPVLAGFILGYALYGVWIGVAVAMAAIGALIAVARLPRPAGLEV